ncbi:probable serine/threonine-protein kinase PBL22 [Rutidosis leptorrhynchoides]|uniref:probable serine/threonine-protein kinase PBL22 n=1 Tax=Rutidosis leptorrhynchoides TaxID=125765 RepID=UPI003A997002
MILVFEKCHHFLWNYLKDKDRSVLTWTKRVRICLDVAYGLKYLHFEKEDQKMILHRNISSFAIVLDENFGAKICNFGYSVFVGPNLNDCQLFDRPLSYIKYYRDAYNVNTREFKREWDVYSFGVVLLEIACGKLAYDDIYTTNDEDDGLAAVARRCFRNETLKEMIDPSIMREEETGENNFSLFRGPNQNSLDAFLKIAVECVDLTRDKRPTMKVVVAELKNALSYQETHKDPLGISFKDVQFATENFYETHFVGQGGFGKVYKGKLLHGNRTIVAKLLDISGGQGEKQFRNELQILSEYKHNNIISLVGYCAENDAKIIVYEYAPRGSLDRYLSDTRLDWMKRLNICIDVSTALDFLHRGVGKQATVIHRDIKTENVLLTDEWNAKLADFGLSLISAINKETDYVIDGACGTPGYVDPLYVKSSFLTKESDIYSFGVVLFEILCGRPTYVIRKQEGVYLPVFIKDMFEKGTQDDVVFKDIKAQIKPEALSVFQTIAYKCLNDKREDRPTAEEVVKQLKKALELQVSYHNLRVLIFLLTTLPPTV